MKRTIISMLIGASFALASPTVITITPAGSIAAAVADRDAWLAANFPSGYTLQLTETFESFGYGPYTSLSTGVGTFSIPADSVAGEAYNSAGTKTLAFTVLNSTNTPFSGRYDTTPGGQNWLDSNDITKLQLTTSLSSLYFFMTDVGDITGTLQVKTNDGTTTAGFGAPGVDGNIYFVGITSSSSLGTVQWLNTYNGDGFGLDDFGRVNDPIISPPAVPEPASWPIAAAALLAIPAIRMWKSRAKKSDVLASAPIA